MSVVPLVLEVPPGTVGPLKQFSRREGGQEWDAGALILLKNPFFHQKGQSPIIFQGEEEIGNTYQLGSKEV